MLQESNPGGQQNVLFLQLINRLIAALRMGTPCVTIPGKS